MADRTIVFPSRSSSAVKVDPSRPSAAAETVAAKAPASAAVVRRGLTLVKGNGAAAISTRVLTPRLSQTQAIVAQVEREVAAMAARRAVAQRSGVPLPAPGRETPWRVLARVLRLAFGR
jgi:hypothetical protein